MTTGSGSAPTVARRPPDRGRSSAPRAAPPYQSGPGCGGDGRASAPAPAAGRGQPLRPRPRRRPWLPRLRHMLLRRRSRPGECRRPPRSLRPSQRILVNPILVIVGILVIVAVIAGVGYYLMNNGSKGSPGAGGSHAAGVSGATTPRLPSPITPARGPVIYPGSIVFSPSTVSCGDSLTVTITLPATVKETDQITLKIDGKTKGSHTVVDQGMTKQADGKWYQTASGPVDCTLGAGLHTEDLVDANGTVLAEGYFTIVGSAATPTPKLTPKATAKRPRAPSPSRRPASAARPRRSRLPSPSTAIIRVRFRPGHRRDRRHRGTDRCGVLVFHPAVRRELV